MRPTRAVEHAAPKCRRCCLVPPREKIRGKPDRAEALPTFYRPQEGRRPPCGGLVGLVASGRDRKEATHAAAQRKTNHAAHQGGGRGTPQVLTALSGSTVGKNQRKTGQSASAANFLPALEVPLHDPPRRWDARPSRVGAV